MVQLTDTDRLLNGREVLGILGVSRATLFRMIRQGRFPKGIQVSDRAVRWRESVVNEYIDNCPPAGSESDDPLRAQRAGATPRSLQSDDSEVTHGDVITGGDAAQS